MSLTDTPTREAIADALDKAADHIDRVGHIKGSYYNNSQRHDGTPLDDCAVCALGGIRWAVHGHPVGGPTDAAKEALRDAVIWAFRDYLTATVGMDLIADWNDADTTTPEDVTTAMRATAVGLREA